MTNKMFPAFMLGAWLVSGEALADELTQIIQRDLVTLGYQPGNTDGEPSVETAIAISKFQAEHGLEVTGAATPQLAGIIKAAISGTALAAPANAPAPARDPLALQAAQQACLQQKVTERQEAQKRTRGLTRLANAVTRTASRLGGSEISSEVAELSSDLYTAGAVAADLKGAAEDLGLTESDVEECRTPQ